MEKKVLTSLCFYLSQIVDTRNRSGLRHPLGSFLMMISCAMVCGFSKKREMARFMVRNKSYFVEHFGLKHGVPNHVSIGNILESIDVDNFSKVLEGWVLEMEKENVDFGEAGVQNWFSLDGKSLNSTINDVETSEQNGVCVVSMLSHGSGLVVSEDNYEGKKDCEQAVVRRLIEEWADRKVVFIMDALHCQKKRLKAS